MAVIGGAKKQSNLEKLYMHLNQPKLVNKLSFFRLLATTQKAGLGIKDSLASIEKAEIHPGMKKILKDTIEQINEGIALSDTFTKYSSFFLSAEIEMIRSAEKIGNLPETLESMSKEIEKFQSIKNKIKSAMMYPSVVISISIFAVIILLWKVIPSIIQIFPAGTSLPGITQFVINASNYIQTNYVMIFLILILIPVIYIILYKKILIFKVFVDKFMLKMPVIGPLIKTFYWYRFSRLLGDFYNAGISPISALTQISDIFSNYHYKKKVLDVKKDLEVGLEMAASFEGSWLFNPILVQIIGIGEQTGNVGEVLIKMADFYREELDTKVEGLTKMIEPILMVFVAGVIGTIVASIFLPMADLIGSLSSG